MKTLVVYYTRTGYTKIVAESVAKGLDCDIEEIVDNKKRNGFIGSAGAYLSPVNKKTTIEEIKADLRKYDTVIVGTPIWWYTISPAAREFITKNKSKIDDMALFYTCGKDTRINVEADVTDLFGKSPSANVGIESETIKNKTFEKKVDSFVMELKR